MKVVLVAHPGGCRSPIVYMITGALIVVACLAAIGAAPAVLATTAISWSGVVLAAARPEGLGFGPVKFGVPLGAGIGTVVVPVVLPAFVLAAVRHAIVCVVVRARGRLVPFGRALAGASIVTVVAGFPGRL